MDFWEFYLDRSRANFYQEWFEYMEDRECYDDYHFGKEQEGQIICLGGEEENG